MEKESKRDVVYAARITLTPTGRKRTEAQLNADLHRARSAAEKKFKKQQKQEALGLAVESEGGFYGLGSDWIVLCAILAPYVGEAVKGFVSGASKKMGEATGEKLIALFLRELRKVHLLPGPAVPAPEITTVTVPDPKATPRKAEKRQAPKKQKPKRGKR
jgi:hypothetical protein